MDGCSPDAILEAVRAAATQDPRMAAHIKQAGVMLKAWEANVPYYYTVLQAIVTNSDIEPECRQMAVTQLYHGIQNRWRKTCSKPILPDDKLKIRAGLLSYGGEVRAINKHVADCIAKIASQDVARNGWPELFPTIFSALVSQPQRESDTENVGRLQKQALLTLYRILKEIGSRPVSPARAFVDTIVNDVLSYTTTACYKSTTAVLSALEHGQSVPEELIMTARVSLKCNRVMILSMSKSLNSQTVWAFLSFISDCLAKLMVSHLEAVVDNQQLSKFVQHIGKIYVNENLEKLVLYQYLMSSQEVDEAGVNSVGLKTPRIYYEMLVRLPPEEDKVVATVLMQGMLFLRQMLDKNTYAPKDQAQRPFFERARQFVLERVFTASLTQNLLGLLVSKYVPLTATDLEEWECEPGLMMMDEADKNTTQSLNACAKAFVVELFKYNKQLLGPQIMDMMRVAAESPNLDSLNSIIQQDAVYSILGMLADELHEDGRFEAWFRGRLAQEATLRGPPGNDGSYRIIRRRVAWLLGQLMRPLGPPERANIEAAVYSTLSQLLHPSEDIVVRFMAFQSLSQCFDDMDASVDAFLPFAADAMANGLQLLALIDDPTRQTSVFHHLSGILAKLDTKARPFIPMLVEALPRHWVGSEGVAMDDLFMVRSHLLNISHILVKIVGEESSFFYPMFIPYIEYSVDETQQGHEMLWQEALVLWNTVLANAIQLTPELLGLFRFVFPLFEKGQIEVAIVFRIVENYILLDPLSVLQAYAVPLFGSLRQLTIGSSSEELSRTSISRLDPELANAITHTIDTTAQACRGANSFRALADVMVSTGMLGAIIGVALIEGTEEDRGDAGDLDDLESGSGFNGLPARVRARFATLLARFMVYDIEAIGGYLDAELSKSIGPQWPRIVVRALLDTYDFHTYNRPRYLYGMAVATLMATGNPSLFENQNDVVRLVGLVSGVMVTIAMNSDDDGLLQTYVPSDFDEDDNTPARRRQLELQEKDVMMLLGALNYIRVQLGGCETNLGGPAVFRELVLDRVDPDLARTLLNPVVSVASEIM
ncbi:armadillo-type protein [Cladochytrium replicatum]|nr:armadillo-type protein [Cladochytrium replicatum]